MLGHGTFGVVLAGNRVADSMQVAVTIEQVEEGSHLNQLSCAQLLQTQSHPNVLELLDTFVDATERFFCDRLPPSLV